MPDIELTQAEIDLLFAYHAAEVEASVLFARAEIAYRKQRVELMDAMENVSGAKEAMFAQVVQTHGLDPECFEVDIESGHIRQKRHVTLIEAAESTPDKDEVYEQRRGAVVSMRPVQEPTDEGDG